MLQVSARQTQSLEPILFPKLRIYFADFPYLHCSINQRLLTLETCCGYEYERTRKSISPSDFQGPSGAHRTPHEVWCFTGHQTISPGNQIPWCQAVNKKRELFPGLLPTSPNSVALPQIYRRTEVTSIEYQHSGSGILTRFPFDKRSKIGHFETEFPYLLGSTNPCPTAVHMEPFSTSVFKVLI